MEEETLSVVPETEIETETGARPDVGPITESVAEDGQGSESAVTPDIEGEALQDEMETFPEPLENPQEKETVSGADEADPESFLPSPGTVLEVENLVIHVSEGVTVTGLVPEPAEESLEGVEEELSGDFPIAYVASNALSLSIPENYVVFMLGDTQLVFPSNYVDDMLLVDGYLVNFGSPVTIAVNLSSSATVGNYIISQVTFPTYGSSDYISYVTSYGSPYRIVDRYRNSSGNITSYTRSTSAAMTAQVITQPGWYGFSGGRMYGYMFAVAVLFLLVWGRFRWKH